MLQKNVILLIILWGLLPIENVLSQASSASETYTLEILDEETLLPINNAFVFVENSSTGTNSNEQGIASINLRNFNQVNLIITHLNYETLSIPRKKLSKLAPITIYLRPKLLDIQEVIVSSKKTRNRKRSQWMRQFESAFYGKNINKKDIELLNPEVLWFQEKGDTLVAQAIDYLLFINRSSGYEMRFFLDDFYIDQNEDTRYAGKVFFKDIKSSLKRTRKVDKRRELNYLNSKTFFFQSLIRELPIHTERFEFGITTIGEGEEVSYQTLQFKDLNWKRGKRADTLYLQGHLGVIHHTILLNDKTVTSGTRKRFVDNKPATSFLYSRSGQFVVDPQGQLLNAHEVEESGYWAEQRFATELPIDYQSINVIPAQLEDSPPVLDSLAAYRYLQTPEKVYVHTNKAQYSNREQMWFKAYLVDGVSHMPLSKSEVLYVDLIDPSGERIHNWMLHRDLGLHGDFQWNRNYSAGTYRLLAYTNNMRNHPEEFFFEQKIELMDYLQVNPPIETPKDQAAVNLSLQFFPEGGDLYAGISSKVAFQAKLSDGSPVEVSGNLYDQKGNALLSFKTAHRGYGSFRLMPQATTTYFAKLKYRGQELEFPLPKVINEGLSLHINPTSQDFIYLDVNTTPNTSLKGAFLVGHVRGALFCYIEELEGGKPIQLLKDQIPNGLLHFTLFDSDSRPQAERLVFNEKALPNASFSVGPVSTGSNHHEKIRIPIQLDTNLLEEAVDVSVSVLNPYLNYIPAIDQNIQSYLLLNADLATPIPFSNYYVNNSNTQKRFFLDLILLCQTWRRFNWKDLSGPSPKASFLAEKGYTIQGYTTRKNSEERVQAEIMLNSFDSSFLHKKIQTDASGNFQFTQLPTMDSTTFILQGRINNGKKSQNEYAVKGDRLLEFHLQPSYLDALPPTKLDAFTILTQSASMSLTQKQLLQDKALQDEQRTTSEWQIDLETVTIDAKRSYRNNGADAGKFYNLEAMDWISPEMNGQTLISKLAPGWNYFRGPSGNLEFHTFDDQGVPIRFPVTILIDGVGRGMDGMALRFLSLSADDIASLYVNGPVISVQLRPISRTRQAYLDSGILQYQHPAYSEARTFSASIYQDTVSELRSALYWEPQLRLDTNGKAFIELDKHQKLNEIHLRIEGISASGVPIFKAANIPLSKMDK